MNIEIRRLLASTLTLVKIEEGGCSIDLGLLDKEEAIALATDFVEAAQELLHAAHA